MLRGNSNLDRFLGTGTKVVYIKNVGIRDWVRERIKISVKTLASWLEHVLSTHPDNVNLFRGLTHIGYGEHDNTVFRNSWCSHTWFSVACFKASTEGI